MFGVAVEVSARKIVRRSGTEYVVGFVVVGGANVEAVDTNNESAPAQMSEQMCVRRAADKRQTPSHKRAALTL